MFKLSSKTEKRIKKVLWHIAKPDYATNFGIRLPLNIPAITPPIRKDIFFGGYEAKEAELVQKNIVSGDVVMEIGAGIGFLSSLCAKVTGNERVHAYEANPQLMETIQHVHKTNKVSPFVYNVLLGDGNGERTFWLEPDYWASSLIHGSEQAMPIQVRQIDLNAEIDRIKPTFMIIDIEGGEYELLHLANLDSVVKLCIEVHPHVLGNQRISEILGWLFDAGFAIDFSCIRKNVFYLYRP